MKTKIETKLIYRECPYCRRVVPPSYDIKEHIELCKKIKRNNK